MRKEWPRISLALVLFFSFSIMVACGGGGSGSSGNSTSGTGSEIGQFLLVADAHCSTDNSNCVGGLGGNGVAVYRLGTTAGSLTAVNGSPYFTGSFPTSAAVSPRGNLAVVSNRKQSTSGAGADSLSVFKVALDGTLAQVSGSPFASGVAPDAIAFDPLSRFVYAVGQGGVQAYSVGANSALLPVGSPAPGAGSSVATEGSGKLIFVAGPNGLTAYVVAADGTLSPASGSPISIVGARDVAILPERNLGYVTYKNGALSGIRSFTFDANAATVANGSDYLTGTRGFAGLVFNRTSSLGYSVTRDTNEVVAFKVDASAGTLTETASVALPQGSGSSVALDSAGTVLFSTGSGINVMALDSAGGISNPQNAHDCQCVTATGYKSATVVRPTN